MQEMRPKAEQEMPEWQREALDRERSRPRNIDDVLRAIESLSHTINDIQARIHRIEQHLKLGAAL